MSPFVQRCAPRSHGDVHGRSCTTFPHSAYAVAADFSTPVMYDIYTGIVDGRPVPHDWNEGAMVFLAKQGVDVRRLVPMESAIRSLTLGNSAGKIIAKLQSISLAEPPLSPNSSRRGVVLRRSQSRQQAMRQTNEQANKQSSNTHTHTHKHGYKH